MSEIDELRARLRVLEDIEAIRRLKYRYWRSIREGNWQDVAECFSSEGTVDFGPDIRFDSKEAIMNFFRHNMEKSFGLIVPQGHNPEIYVTGETEASGRWLLDNLMLETDTGTVARIGVSYEEEYVKENGR